MNWQDMIKFNKEHLGKFVNNKEFWKRFNELEDLFEVIDDDLRDYERIKYITLNEFLLQNRIDKAIEYIEKNSKQCLTNKIDEHPTKVIGKFMWHIDDLLDILKESGE